jgi:hypothetical protein
MPGFADANLGCLVPVRRVVARVALVSMDTQG